jgi:transposase
MSDESKRIRIEEPNRSQVQMVVADDLLAADHPARVLWDVTGALDLSRFFVGVRVAHGSAGRSLKSPRMKLCLWLYAMTQGIGSAREIARRTKTELAFRWIVGDVALTHDTLSAFRRQQGAAFDNALTQILGSLMHAGALSFELVALDGMRVRASASAPSFRSAPSLEQCREQAQLHVKAVLAQADDPELTKAQKAAREAKARDFQKRVEAAIATVESLAKRPDPPARPRASTTDAEARVMKMGDGGFRPAYNVQLATVGSPMGGPRTVVGVQVTNVGSDMGAMPALLDDVERRTGTTPRVTLADGGHASHEAIRNAEARGTTAIVAVPEQTRRKPLETETDPVIAAWRRRMDTDEAKALYRARASLCELLNARMRAYGLDQFLVRGLRNVTNVVLLAVLASNILQHASTLLG